MLIITPRISIDENELDEKFVRASGPGGQNVNKVATAVQLRFDVRRSASLPEPVRERLLRLAANRATEEGILIIEARQFRTQEQNRHDARQRLIALIRKALETPKPRRATKPTRAAKARRMEGKRIRGQIKKLRKSDHSGGRDEADR
ncbi:MAG: aminoacyl-tRNA hydrolase [Nitrospirales bacterium]|nr:aminoacyl-tRNA hydrolase [Nitrospirales bacterium]